MCNSICGIDCDSCPSYESCNGCRTTNGNPFLGGCVVASCHLKKTCKDRGQCFQASCLYQNQLIDEFRALAITDMEEITSLHALKGSYVNLEYTLPNGQVVKLLDDNKIYLGNQVHKIGSSRCYGILADEMHLIVCEYGEFGSEAEIIVYQKRKK